MGMGQWEQASEMCGRLATLLDDGSGGGSPRSKRPPPPFLSTLLTTVISILSVGRDTPSHISNLESSLKGHEPRNAALYLKLARLLSRIAGRSRVVLTFTLQLMTTSVSLSPTCSNLCELAYQHRLSGSYGLAHDTYRDAAKVDSTDPCAIHGGIYCQIMQGAVDDAGEQLEFLSVVQGEEAEAESEVLFLRALLASRKDKDGERHLERHLELLDQTGRAFAAERKEHVKEDVFDEYISSNPDFMVELAKEYLTHLSAPSESVRDSSNSDNSDDDLPVPVQAGLDILETVTGSVPALLDAHLVVAKANFEMGKLTKARTCLNHCLSINPQHSGTYLTLAQLHLAQDGYRSANNALEQALSYDFKIRNDPIYHLAKSSCLANAGSLSAAKSQLESAMKLPGVRDGAGGTVTMPDRVKIFVKLAEVYSKLNMLGEAKEVLSEGRAAFEGTAEQVREPHTHLNCFPPFLLFSFRSFSVLFLSSDFLILLIQSFLLIPPPLQPLFSNFSLCCSFCSICSRSAFWWPSPTSPSRRTTSSRRSTCCPRSLLRLPFTLTRALRRPTST